MVITEEQVQKVLDATKIRNELCGEYGKGVSKGLFDVIVPECKTEKACPECGIYRYYEIEQNHKVIFTTTMLFEAVEKYNAI